MDSKSLQPSTDTEQRLLESAGEVFAEKGFRAATIRDIIQRAGANIAAVNYHFGDKEGLYAAVFRYARKCCEAQYPIGTAAGASPRKRLHAFIRSIVLRLLDRGRPAWHWQLMAREMMSPTGALDEMVENCIKPEFEILARIICDLAGLPRSDARVELCVNSVIGQALFYRHAQEVVHRLHPRQTFDPKDLDDLADHITEFSMGGFETIARKAAPRSNGKHRSAKPERRA
jgi:AcrR family transcriptional regulator